MQNNWKRWLIEGGAVLIAAALMYRLAFPASSPLTRFAAAPTTSPSAFVLPANFTPTQPTAQPAPAQSPPLILRGSGEGVTEPIFLQPGLVLFHIRHAQATPFAMFLLNAADEHLALLANASAPFSGTQAFGIRQPGNYYLHVIGTDAWSVQPETMTPATSAPFTSLAGTGMVVSAPLAFSAGTHDFGWNHVGTLGFSAVLWSVDGSQRLEIVNASALTGGSAAIVVPTPDTYVLMVQADGTWQVDAAP